MSIIGVQISHANTHPADAEFCQMCDPAAWLVGATPELVERTRAIIRAQREDAEETRRLVREWDVTLPELPA